MGLFFAKAAASTYPTRIAIMAASNTDVPPSYSDALANSIPVSLQMAVWYS